MKPLKTGARRQLSVTDSRRARGHFKPVEWPAELAQDIPALPDPIARFLREPWVCSVRREVRGLSERDYCDLLLAFANDGELATEQWQSLLSGALPEQDGSVLKRRSVSVIGPGYLDLIVRDQLDQLVSLGPDRAQSALGKDWAEKASSAGLVLLPVFESDSGAVRISYRLLARDLPAAITYVMMLFMDSARPFGRDLCRCQLKECERFFWVVRQAAGRPRDTYCSQEHMKEAHRRQVRERVAKHRARKVRRRSK